MGRSHLSSHSDLIKNGPTWQVGSLKSRGEYVKEPRYRTDTQDLMCKADARSKADASPSHRDDALNMSTTCAGQLITSPICFTQIQPHPPSPTIEQTNPRSVPAQPRKFSCITKRPTTTTIWKYPYPSRIPFVIKPTQTPAKERPTEPKKNDRLLFGYTIKNNPYQANKQQKSPRLLGRK